MDRDFLIVTTPTVSNVNVKKYLGSVSTNAVLGVNFISEFFASITDVLGGFSEIYKNKLAIIYEKVKENLKDEALKIGANAILDFKVDFDQLTGNRSMLMVSATGTAVILEYPKIKRTYRFYNDKVSLDELNLSNETFELREKIEHTKYIPIDEDIDKIKNIDNISEIILLNYLDLYNSPSSNKLKTNINECKNSVITLLLSLTEEEQENLLYKHFNKSRPGIIDLIKSLNRFSAHHISNLLPFLTEENKKQLLWATRESYDYKEIEDLKNLLQLLNKKTDNRKTEVKKNLLSADKYYTICECGKEIDRNETYCPFCHKDEHGQTETEHEAIQYLSHLIDKLTELIKNKKNDHK